MIFRQWGRNNYSVFNTLGKNIKISVLCFTYSLLLLHSPNYAQTDSLTVSRSLDIDEVIVSGQRAPVVYSRLSRVVNTFSEEELRMIPASSLEEALSYASGIDVRQRGPQGVQADLSIRGGSFDQNLVLLNGIDVTDPQTGHFALNLPVNLSDVNKIEILKGPGSRIFGPNAFKGAVNIITRPADTNRISLRMNLGQNKLFETAFKTSLSHKSYRHFTAISYKSSEGYTQNTDFDVSNAFYHGLYSIDNSEINLQAGYKDKAFGAQSFFTPEYPNQFEQNKIYFAALSATTGTVLQFKPSIYWRRHKDRFELFRESDDWYSREGDYFVKGESDTAKYIPGVYEPWNYYSGHNYHLTDVYGAAADFSYSSFLGQTSLGLEYREEKILSNVLGEQMSDTIDMESSNGFYDKSYSRYQFNAYFEHVLYYKEWTISSGILANRSNEFKQGWKFYPGIDLSYRLNNTFKLFAAFNNSLRLPTFTDLFYDGPSNQGNPDLIPERITSYETGMKVDGNILTGYASLFYSEADNLIAWVLFDNEESSQYTAQNLTVVNNIGCELSSKFILPGQLADMLTFSYTFLDQQKQTNGFDSKYSLSYLKHKLILSLNGEIVNNVYYSLTGTYRDRNGDYKYYDEKMDSYTGTRSYDPYWIFDGKIQWQKDSWHIFLKVSNLLGVDYQSTGNIEMPGRWIIAGVEKQFNL